MATTTTAAAASQYLRRQALLDASSHMDSLRMAQTGAIGIQRPYLEPGTMRDMRVPSSLTMGSGSGRGSTSVMPDNLSQYSQQQQQQQQIYNSTSSSGSGSSGKELNIGTTGSDSLKKRRATENSEHSDNLMKRIRPSNYNEGQQQQQQHYK